MRHALAAALVLGLVGALTASAAGCGDDPPGAASTDDAGVDVGADSAPAGGDAAAADPGAADPGPAPDVSPDPGPPDVWPPPKGETEWLSFDDDAGNGPLSYTETPSHYYEYVRFQIERPARLWGLRAQLDVPMSTKATLHVWDDWGGNFYAFQVDAPLATVTRDVSPLDSAQWVELPLSEPVDLVPGRMVYAGLVVHGIGGPRLIADAAQATPEGQAASSIIWMADEPPDELGFPTLLHAPGDFMLRLEAEWIHTVDDADKDFEPIAPEDLGIPGLSRLAFADVDGDGDLDVMTNGPKLFLGDGAGAFTDVTETWLEGITGHNGGAFGDYDNDGDPDYFATGVADRLLRNDGDHFTDVTVEAGIDDTQWFNCNGDERDQNVPTEAAVWLDVDNDGWLDVYQANMICWDPPAVAARDLLWRNQGDGTFADATSETGLSKGQGQAGRGLAPADANGDGWTDLLVTNYRLHKNLYFESVGGGLLKGVGYETGLEGDRVDGYYGHSIGAAWGDVDHDGDLDVFIANLAHPRFFDFSDPARLYLNPGVSEAPFLDVTDLIGIRYLETPSNPNLFDYDNDGDLDLFYTCIYEGRTSQLYRNDGHPTWTEVTYETGVAVYNGWGSAVGDIDGDGDLDLLAGGQYFRNRNPAGHGAVTVRVEGLGDGMTNRDGVGARVTATVGGRLLLRERVGGHGTGVQDSPWLHLGLGDAPSVDLEVTFPASGTTVPVAAVPAGSFVHVVEDGTVTIE